MAITDVENIQEDQPVASAIEPWLSVRDSLAAAAFYKSAFGAIETYRLEPPEGGPVLKLSVGGAAFWGGEEPSGNEAAESVGGGTVRMILTVTDPDAVFSRAIKSGAMEIFPVGEEHGWRLGRIV